MLFELLKKIDEKQDSHTEILAKLENNVERNTDDLHLHIKRTDLLEEQVELNKKLLEERLDKVEQPGKVVTSISSFVLKLSAVLAGTYAIVELFKKFI